MEKIKVQSIMFLWKEGHVSDLPGPLTLSTWSEANERLSIWSANAPKTGGYDKVGFRITWADGHQYNGRYDLQHWEVEPSDLIAHVRGYVEFCAGLRCPSHMKKEEYLAYVENRPAMRDQALAFLDTYSFED